MHNKYHLFLLLYVFYLPFIKAQSIDYQEIGIDREAKKIYIPYTIKESPKYHNLYGIQVFYSQDNGKNYIGPLKKVSGDVGKDITPGEKVIVWDYHEEDSTFNGQDVLFKLLVTYRPDPNFLGGPENALYSLALSGWGDTKVWQRPKWWFLNTIATYGLLGSGVYMRIKSNNTRQDYLNSSSVEEAQDLFDQSNRQKKIGSSLLLAGAAVWLTDITRVIIKGFKNRKEVLNMRKQKENIPTPEKSSLNFEINHFQNQITIGITIKF